MHKNLSGSTLHSTTHQEPTNHPLVNVRPKQACKDMGISMSWMYVLIERGILPKPHNIYPGSKAVAFYRHELDAVIAGRYAGREGR